MKRPLVGVAPHEALALRHADDVGALSAPLQEDDSALAGRKPRHPVHGLDDVADGPPGCTTVKRVAGAACPSSSRRQ